MLLYQVLTALMFIFKLQVFGSHKKELMYKIICLIYLTKFVISRIRHWCLNDFPNQSPSEHFSVFKENHSFIIALQSFYYFSGKIMYHMFLQVCGARYLTTCNVKDHCTHPAPSTTWEAFQTQTANELVDGRCQCATGH